MLYEFITYRGFNIRFTNAHKYYKFCIFDDWYETLDECKRLIDDYIEEHEEAFTQLMESEG